MLEAVYYYYPHMPIDNVWIYCSLFVCLYVCVSLFVQLRIFPARMKLAMSNFARKFIGVLGRESPILGNFAPPEAQNRTNRRATASIADRHQSPLLTVHSPSVDGTGVYRQYLPLACGYMADTEDGRTCYYYYYASTRLALQHSQSCLMFVFSYCRILASLKHPHIVAFHESIHDADKKVLFIIQVIFIIIRLHRSDS